MKHNFNFNGNYVAIGSDEETDISKLFINLEEDGSAVSEVIDSLSGNEIDLAPSVHAVNERFTYSTDEQVIGIWLGKPLYRKTVSCGVLPNNTSKTINTNIANISRVVRMYGYSFNGTNTFFPIPHSNPNPVSLSFFNASNDNNGITIQTTIDRSGFTETYVTIEYTKTTD